MVNSVVIDWVHEGVKFCKAKEELYLPKRDQKVWLLSNGSDRLQSDGTRACSMSTHPLRWMVFSARCGCAAGNVAVPSQ